MGDAIASSTRTITISKSIMSVSSLKGMFLFFNSGKLS